MKIRYPLAAFAVAATTTFASSGAVGASYLTGCYAEDKGTGVTAMCTKVKKTKGKDRLRVVAVATCSNGDDRIVKRDRTPNRALETSTVYCPDGFYVEDFDFEVVSK